MTMTDNELLLAISEMMDKKLDSKLEPLKIDIQELKTEINGLKLDNENVIKPQICLLAENYVPAAKRYEKATAKIDAMQNDIDIIKKVVAEHSEKLRKIS